MGSQVTSHIVKSNKQYKIKTIIKPEKYSGTTYFQNHKIKENRVFFWVKDTLEKCKINYQEFKMHLRGWCVQAGNLYAAWCLNDHTPVLRLGMTPLHSTL